MLGKAKHALRSKSIIFIVILLIVYDERTVNYAAPDYNRAFMGVLRYHSNIPYCYASRLPHDRGVQGASDIASILANQIPFPILDAPVA